MKTKDSVDVDDLRDVAREWIKEIEIILNCDNKRFLESNDKWLQKWIDETSYRGNWDRDALIYWIKHFFNLEEE